jgi:hypothetical protein
MLALYIPLGVSETIGKVSSNKREQIDLILTRFSFKKKLCYLTELKTLDHFTVGVLYILWFTERVRFGFILKKKLLTNIISKYNQYLVVFDNLHCFWWFSAVSSDRMKLITSVYVSLSTGTKSAKSHSSSDKLFEKRLIRVI